MCISETCLGDLISGRSRVWRHLPTSGSSYGLRMLNLYTSTILFRQSGKNSTGVQRQQRVKFGHTIIIFDFFLWDLVHVVDFSVKLCVPSSFVLVASLVLWASNHQEIRSGMAPLLAQTQGGSREKRGAFIEEECSTWSSQASGIALACWAPAAVPTDR